MADKKIDINDKVSNDTLIYPCNKKYRVFDFAKQTVDVIIKDGFFDSDLQHEIEFRRKQDLPDFVPGLLSSSSHGYKEVIIDGKPLARISDGFETFKDTAFKLLCEYRKNYTTKEDSITYRNRLIEEINQLVTTKVNQKELLSKIISMLMVFSLDESIELTFSHGDLQYGNIWVENGSNKIYIIDWESWKIRSAWYDKAILYDNLRPGGLDAYFNQETSITERVFVLLEDIIFQMTELNNLPDNYGEDQFERYLIKLSNYIEEGEYYAI